jgi:hypothetical protein
MQYDDCKAKTKKWNHFAQVDTLGSFDFYTTIIFLDSIRSDDLYELQKDLHYLVGSNDFSEVEQFTPNQYTQLAKLLPLAAHEYTHFVDATSTLWGLQHLNRMNDAYNSDNRRGGKESTFYKAKEFYDHIRGIRLPNYYTVTSQSALNNRPWQSNITIGRIFSQQGRPSSRPVLFSWFSNNQGDPLVRSPISTVSLLEASAMAQEILMHINLIENTDADFKLVEYSAFARRTLDHLYNPEITEYSVCVHTLANRVGCKDIISAFALCAFLTRLVLNFPRSAFDKILKSCQIADILKIPKGHDFERAIADGIKHKDIGILFFLLCNALPKNTHKNPQKMKEALYSAINAIGVEYEFVKNEAQNEARILFESMKSSSIKSISTLANAGYDNFKRIGFDQVGLDFNRINLPPAFLGDSSKLSVFGTVDNMLSKLDLDECFDELFEGQSWVERFSEACL